MKNLIILLAVVCLIFFSCGKEEQPAVEKKMESTPEVVKEEPVKGVKESVKPPEEVVETEVEATKPEMVEKAVEKTGEVVEATYITEARVHAAACTGLVYDTITEPIRPVVCYSKPHSVIPFLSGSTRCSQISVYNPDILRADVCTLTGGQPPCSMRVMFG